MADERRPLWQAGCRLRRRRGTPATRRGGLEHGATCSKACRARLSSMKETADGIQDWTGDDCDAAIPGVPNGIPVHGSNIGGTQDAPTQRRFANPGRSYNPTSHFSSRLIPAGAQPHFLDTAGFGRRQPRFLKETWISEAVDRRGNEPNQGQDKTDGHAVVLVGQPAHQRWCDGAAND